MEGVEEIPHAALAAGLRWDWETFPDPLDADRRHAEDDRCGGADPARPAACVRPFAGRGIRNQRATTDEIARHGRARRRGHRRRRARDHDLAHGAAPRERRRSRARDVRRRKTSSSRLGRALPRVGRSVLEVAPAGIQGEDMAAPARELDWMRRVAEEIERPVTFGCVQHDITPDDWHRLLDAGAPGRPHRHPAAPAGDRPPGRPRPRAADPPPTVPPPDLHRATPRLPLDERVAPPPRPRRPRSHPERDAPRWRSPTTTAWASTASSCSVTRPTTSRRRS